MKKIFSVIMEFLCTFAFLFCFSGCSIFPGLGGGTGGSGGTGGGTGGTGGSGGGSSDWEQPVDDPEFDVDEDGNYSYFSDYISAFDGVRVMSVPPADAKSGNELTDAERERFYANVYTQFEVMSKYILYSLVGEYGGGISDMTIKGSNTMATLGTKKDYGEDYELVLHAKVPESRVNGNREIVSTNRYNIEFEISGFSIEDFTIIQIPSKEYQVGSMEYNLMLTFDPSSKWLLNLNKTNLPADDNAYAEEYVETFKGFVQLRIMEIVLNQTTGSNYKTSWAYASNPSECSKKLKEYTKMFTKLGFEMGNLNQPDSIASQIYKMILDEVIGQPHITKDQMMKIYIAEIWFSQAPKYFEAYTDENENGQYDNGEPFVDVNKNGVWDDRIYVDLNLNGKYDDKNIDGVGCTFPNWDLNIGYVFRGTVPNIVTNLIDSCANFIDIYALEVQDLTSKEFFKPGIAKTDKTPRKLDNMPYAEYKSVLFLPKENTKFDTLTIYVDSETNFSMKIWLKVHFGEGNEFYVPVCILNLNSEKDCDFTNEDDAFDWDTNISDDFPDSWTDPKLLFDDKERNSVWLLELSEIMSEEQYLALTTTGVAGYGKELEYEQRGYHTNSKDNTELKDLYNMTSFGESYTDANGNQKFDAGEAFADNNKNEIFDFGESLGYVGDGVYFEFIFEILNREPDKEYNFKFLIMPQFWDVENADEDFEDIDW